MLPYIFLVKMRNMTNYENVFHMLLCYFLLTNLACSLNFYFKTLCRHQSNNICHYKLIHKLFVDQSSRLVRKNIRCGTYVFIITRISCFYKRNMWKHMMEKKEQQLYLHRTVAPSRCAATTTISLFPCFLIEHKRNPYSMVFVDIIITMHSDASIMASKHSTLFFI